MKTLTLDLTPEQEDRLHKAATAAELTPSEFALRCLLAEEERLGFSTAMASEDALASIWDAPEEDEAWQHLQPAAQ